MNSKPTLGDVLPTAKLRLPKVPLPLQTAPPTEDRVFKYPTLWEMLFILTTTASLEDTDFAPSHLILSSSDYL